MQSMSIIFDRGLESRIAEIQSENSGKNQFSSGLLIGHRTSNSIQVIHLARNFGMNLEFDEGDNSTRTRRQSGKKATVSQDFDEQSIMSQVRQASRMLPGGLDIVGFFIVSSPSSKKHGENITTVNKALRTAYKISWKSSSMNGTVDINFSDTSASDGRMILLSLDPAEASGNKKSTTTAIIDCRPDAQSTAPSTMIPFSYQSLRWHGLSTRLTFDVPLFITTTNSADSFMKQFVDAARPWCRKIWTAQAIVNGTLKEDDDAITMTGATSTGKGGKGKKAAAKDIDELDNVEFYFANDSSEPAENRKSTSEAKFNDGTVSMHIRGAMYCTAFVHQKATVADGIRALKIDVFRSLYSRCELHVAGMSVLEGEELDPVAVHQFPRRVFGPFASGNSILMFNDYLFEGDTNADASANFKSLLDLGIETESIDNKYEIIPNETTLEDLLRSSSLSSTPEGSIGDIDRLQLENMQEATKKKVIGKKSSIIYLSLAIIIAIIAYFLLHFLGQ